MFFNQRSRERQSIMDEMLKGRRLKKSHRQGKEERRSDRGEASTDDGKTKGSRGAGKGLVEGGRGLEGGGAVRGGKGSRERGEGKKKGITLRAGSYSKRPEREKDPLASGEKRGREKALTRLKANLVPGPGPVKAL